jgi:hypothetical protein
MYAAGNCAGPASAFGVPAHGAVLVCPRALFLMYSLIARLLSQFHDKRLTDILRGDISQHMYILHISTESKKISLPKASYVKLQPVRFSLDGLALAELICYSFHHCCCAVRTNRSIKTSHVHNTGGMKLWRPQFVQQL